MEGDLLIHEAIEAADVWAFVTVMIINISQHSAHARGSYESFRKSGVNPIGIHSDLHTSVTSIAYQTSVGPSTLKRDDRTIVLFCVTLHGQEVTFAVEATWLCS